MEGQRRCRRGRALGMLRRGWKADPAIGFTKQQDVVHRVVGPPGIVLVGEGNPSRLRAADGHRAPQARARRCPRPRSTRSSAATARARCPLTKLVRHVPKLGQEPQARPR